MKKYIYFDSFDVTMFKICRTSNCKEISKKKDDKKKNMFINYQVYNFFIQKLGLIEVQEYQYQYTLVEKKT